MPLFLITQSIGSVQQGRLKSPPPLLPGADDPDAGVVPLAGENMRLGRE